MYGRGLSFHSPSSKLNGLRAHVDIQSPVLLSVLLPIPVSAHGTSKRIALLELIRHLVVWLSVAAIPCLLSVEHRVHGMRLNVLQRYLSSVVELARMLNGYLPVPIERRRLR